MSRKNNPRSIYMMHRSYLESGAMSLPVFGWLLSRRMGTRIVRDVTGYYLEGIMDCGPDLASEALTEWQTSNPATQFKTWVIANIEWSKT